MPPALTRISIEPDGENYRIAIEMDDETTAEMTATFEQLDLIAEEIDRHLDRDEETALSED